MDGGIIEDEDDKCNRTNNLAFVLDDFGARLAPFCARSYTHDRCNNVRRFPGIGSFSPGEPNQEYRETPSEEDETKIVHSCQLLPFRPVLVQKVECRWVIEEKEQDNRKAGDYDV